MEAYFNALNNARALRASIEERQRRRTLQQRDDRAYQALESQYGVAAAARPEQTMQLQDQENQQRQIQSERYQRAGLAALNAFKAMNDRIATDGATPEQIAAARGQAFDRIAGIMPALGVSAERLSQMREALIANPELADQMISVLENPEQAIERARIAQRDRELAIQSRRLDQGEVGLGLRDRSVGVSEGNLEMRRYEADPTVTYERSRARRAGATDADVAASLPALREFTTRAITSIDGLLNSEGFDAIFGLPNLTRLETGGFGAAGVVPGTPAADALARLNEAEGYAGRAALAILEGQTPVSDADREAVRQSFVSLQRDQSPAAAARALRALQQSLANSLRNAEERGRGGYAPSTTNRPVPRSQQAPRAAASARPAQQQRQGAPAAPTNRNVRRPGESVEDYMRRVGAGGR